MAAVGIFGPLAAHLRWPNSMPAVRQSAFGCWLVAYWPTSLWYLGIDKNSRTSNATIIKKTSTNNLQSLARLLRYIMYLYDVVYRCIWYNVYIIYYHINTKQSVHNLQYLHLVAGYDPRLGRPWSLACWISACRLGTRCQAFGSRQCRFWLFRMDIWSRIIFEISTLYRIYIQYRSVQYIRYNRYNLDYFVGFLDDLEVWWCWFHLHHLQFLLYRTVVR